MRINNWKKFNESFINESIIISQKSYQDGQFGREFDEWKLKCTKKAEEKGWNDWEWVFYNQSEKVSIPHHKGDDVPSNMVLFLVNEKSSGESPNTRKGTFDLKSKKGTLSE